MQTSLRPKTAPPSTAPRPHADVVLSDALLRALPKTDLHLHLDGSLRIPTLIELAAERGVALPATTVEGLTDKVFKESYANLGEYLEGFAWTGAVLQDADALERVAYELAWDNIKEGVCYAEVRFAPHLHMHAGLGFDAVLQAVDRGLARAAAEHAATPEVTEQGVPAFRYGIIVCALRWFETFFSKWYAQLLDSLKYAPRRQVYGMASLELARAAVGCRDKHGVPIVGFDLAGKEDGYPAHDHVEAYAYAHSHFLKKTVHAGEAYGPESIFEAITKLNADRIGHGYHLFSPGLCGPAVKDPERYVERLAEYIADRRITIEVCITSNLQTNPEIIDARHHAFQHMLDRKLSATLCTDNRLVSHTTVSDELRVAVDAFDMTPRQVRSTLIHGFKRSFFPGSYLEKRAWVRQVIDHTDRILDAAQADATSSD